MRGSASPAPKARRQSRGERQALAHPRPVSAETFVTDRRPRTAAVAGSIEFRGHPCFDLRPSCARIGPDGRFVAHSRYPGRADRLSDRIRKLIASHRKPEVTVTRIYAALFAALSLLSAPALAQQAPSSQIEVVEPWARATAATAKTAAAYMTLRNMGTAGDRLVAAATPVAGRTELHTHMKDGDVMRMRQVDAIAVNAHGSANLAPGGLHVMFFDLKAPLKEGEKFPLTLRFEKAGEISTQVSVRSARAMSSGGHTEGHGSGMHR
jgi:copper(I)-binding protein